MPSVLHLGKFYPPDKGGIESVTASLARGAAAAGWTSSVLCFEEHGRGDEQDGLVSVRRVAARKIASQPLSVRYFRESIRHAKAADVVHVHLPNMLAALAVAGVGPGPRILLHWHSDTVGKGALRRACAPIERAMLRRADVVICTSQAYADSSEPLRPYLGKVCVVPIGVGEAYDTAHLDPTGGALPPHIEHQIGGKPLVLAVGRLVPYKGFSVLIDAANRMITDATVVIVGTGPLEKSLRDQIARNALTRVVLTGRLDEQTLAALQRRAKIFCLPSIERSEAFGVALIEAMSRGLPVIATQIPGSGVPWVNEHGCSGLNVTPGNAVELANSLDQLLGDDALRAKLAAGARTRYESHFTETAFIRRMLDLYVRTDANAVSRLP